MKTGTLVLRHTKLETITILGNIVVLKKKKIITISSNGYDKRQFFFSKNKK